MVIFPREEGETIKDVLVRAKAYAKAVQKKYPQATVELISRLHAFAPSAKLEERLYGKASRGDFSNPLWCPYCAKLRNFYDDGEGYKCCEVCHITDHEFHVVKYNHLRLREILKMKAREIKRDKQRKGGK
jgi:hypothetical protein